MRTKGVSLISFIALMALMAVPAQADAAAALQRARELVGTYQKEEAVKLEAIAKGEGAQADAQATAGRKALEEAQQAYESLGVPAKGTKESLFEYANVTRLLGSYDLAAEAMEVAVQQDPADAKAWALLGASAIECGPKHEPRGLAALRKSIALDAKSKDSALAFLALGKLYNQQQLFDLALEALDGAVAADPANAEAVLRRAVLVVRQGKIVEGSTAIDALDKAAQPFDATTRVLLRAALADYENTGGFFEDTHENHAAYAKLLYRAGRLPEAILAGGRAAKLDPKDIQNLNFVGSMYMQAGNAEGARQAYEKSLAADPNQPMIVEVLKQIPAASTPPAPSAGQASAPPALLQK